MLEAYFGRTSAILEQQEQHLTGIHDSRVNNFF